jgi:hypothetical protein
MRETAKLEFKRKKKRFPMVGMAGFEPTTPCSRSKYSTRLSHIPRLWEAQR